MSSFGDVCDMSPSDDMVIVNERPVAPIRPFSLTTTPDDADRASVARPTSGPAVPDEIYTPPMRRSLAVLTVCVAGLLAPLGAQAATRYAAPTGAGPSPAPRPPRAPSRRPSAAASPTGTP